jgi:hypothetical protein
MMVSHPKSSISKSFQWVFFINHPAIAVPSSIETIYPMYFPASEGPEESSCRDLGHRIEGKNGSDDTTIF